MSKSMVMRILADRPVAYHPDLARACGGVKAAIFLCQMLYWTGKGKRKDGFIFKKQAEIEDETGLTEYEQRTARKALKDKGLLDEKQVGVPPILHYRIDTDTLYSLLQEFYSSNSGEHQDLKVDNIQNYKRETSTNIPESTAQSTEPLQGSDDLPPHKQMFKALAETCSIDLSTLTGAQRGQLNQSEKILREAGATPYEVVQFREWWDRHDWRGQQGDAPRPSQVREEWGKYRAWANEDDGWEWV